MTDFINKIVNKVINSVSDAVQTAQPTHKSPETVQTFVTSAQNMLRLENVAGNVTVRGVEGNSLTVRYYKVCNAVSQESADELFKRVNVDVNSSDNGIFIKTVYERGSAKSHVSPYVVYDIDAPKNMPVFIKDCHGNINISDMLSNVEASTVNGGVNAKDCAGSVSLASENGALNVSGNTGSVRLSTTNGSVTADNIKVKNFKAKCVNGSISAHMSLEQGALVSAETVNGGIDLSFPTGTEAQVNYGTVNGKASISISTNPNASSRISANTVNGAIKIRTA